MYSDEITLSKMEYEERVRKGEWGYRFVDIGRERRPSRFISVLLSMLPRF